MRRTINYDKRYFLYLNKTYLNIQKFKKAIIASHNLHIHDLPLKYCFPLVQLNYFFFLKLLNNVHAEV